MQCASIHAYTHTHIHAYNIIPWIQQQLSHASPTKHSTAPFPRTPPAALRPFPPPPSYMHQS